MIAKRPWTCRISFFLLIGCGTVPLMAVSAQTSTPDFTMDPLTRYVHIEYRVPEDAGDAIAVRCTWSPADANAWRPANVTPLISETARRMVAHDVWNRWVKDGVIVEQRAAGLTRTVVFNPYPDAQVDGAVSVDFRIQLETNSGGDVIETQTLRINTDNRDVHYIEDWTNVLTDNAVAAPGDSETPMWTWKTGLDASDGASFGNALYAESGPDTPLPQLAYPLDLTGWYAVYVSTIAPDRGIRLRLSGDERTDLLVSPHATEEILWRWVRMDRQHLVVKQPHRFTGWASGRIDYVRLVPLSEAQVNALDAQVGGETDKTVAGYFEPYSWAFHENVQDTLQHREPLTAFRDARLPIVDVQIGRFGMKVVYETRETDPLIYATIGDPIGNVQRPTTNNVGKMQQYTNTLDAELRYARELGLRVHANFGASNCYPGSPLQGDFSKEHPEWMRSSQLRFEVPEVRDYVLKLYREALEIGAEALTIDFCRYPETIDTPETCNETLKAMRALADEFGAARNTHVPILVRFPATGVRKAELFDYATWAREGWVDYIAPSNIQGRHHSFDVAPYMEAVAGTECAVWPCVDGLGWGLPFPGPFLWRVHELYEAGVPGLHIYQADARVLGRPDDRRTMRLLASSAAVRDWWRRDAELRGEASKGIYITTPMRPEGYHGWERIRVWLDGVPMGAVEIYLDGELLNQYDGPPYLVGSEDYASDKVIPAGEHELRIRAQDGDGWLEQTFRITGA